MTARQRQQMASRFVQLLVLGLGLAVAAAAPPGRYVIDAGTVFDTKTMLTWQREAAADGGAFTLSAANDYCADGGWRLPDVRELQSIVDVRTFEPSIDSAAFPNTPPAYFWSSTTGALGAGFVWAVGFQHGANGNANINQSFSVRCVR